MANVKTNNKDFERKVFFPNEKKKQERTNVWAQTHANMNYEYLNSP